MRRYLPWLVAGVILVAGFVLLIYQLIFLPLNLNPGDNLLVGVIAFVLYSFLIPGTFAVLGALVLTRQPANRVGWLMLVFAVIGVIPLDVIRTVFYPAPQPHWSLGLWVLLWIGNWSWLLGFLTIFLILLNFPDGRPPSPRWNWLGTLAIVLVLFWAATTMFWQEIVTGSGENIWIVVNQIGFIPGIVTNVFAVLIYLGMLVVAAGSIASLIVRIRRGDPIERQQIKWLLFANAMFIVGIGVLILLYATSLGDPGATWPILIPMVGVMAIPVAITIAILRYNLYDIDIIIRRTLVYGSLTAILVALYFGIVVVLQNLLSGITGQQSTIAIVISTLIIAALFNPLRRRIQDLIDRRFYRRKYDAEEALADFSLTVREEVDLESLSLALLGVVDETMQPGHLSLWLKEVPIAGTKHRLSG